MDLDDPRELQRRSLHPSEVATRARPVTQRQAAAIFDSPSEPAGIRWWSTLESSFLDVTLFDRALPEVEIVGVRALDLGDDVVRESADFLGFR